MLAPPLEIGAVNITVKVWLPAVIEEIDGAPAVVADTKDVADEFAAFEEATAFIATT